MRSGVGEWFCRHFTAVPDGPPTGQWKIIVEEMNQAAFEPTPDIGGRNVVATQPDALSYPCERLQPDLLVDGLLEAACRVNPILDSRAD